MKYFLHDSNSFNDEKVTLLYLNFGFEGLGLFYTILEKLASQEKPIKTEVLKHQLKVGKKLEKCWSFMEQIDIISSNNGETFNKQLLNFSEKYKIKSEKNAKRISEWRENQANTKNVTRSECVRNTYKVKESKVNESKVNTYSKMLLSEVGTSDVKNPDHLEIAKQFQNLFRQNLNDAGASTKTVDNAKGTWVDDIRLMLEVDGYSLDDLRAVYNFLKKDKFWKANILSTSKLRDQFSTLKLKLHNGTNNNGFDEAGQRELIEAIQRGYDNAEREKRNQRIQ